jgi:high-affinity iron transporter
VQRSIARSSQWAVSAGILLLALLFFGAPAMAAPSPEEERAQTVIHLLDYVSVDYPNFVRGGQVLNPSEYAEQREFAGQALALLGQLPETADKADLLAQARTLQTQIDAKVQGATVAQQAAKLRVGLIQSYRVTVAPVTPPDTASGARLFESHCSTCHGVEGRGDGPAARGMDSKPANFHASERMDALSLYALYNTVTLGVSGTAMRAFSELTEADRWSLAFYVGNLRFNPDVIAQGQSLWKSGEGRQSLGDLRALVTSTIAQARSTGGASLASEQVYLTAHPEALTAVGPAPLQLARQKLDEALDSYRAGDHERARQLAIASYLEGFELVESSLDNVDAPLRVEVERQMMALRGTIATGGPAEGVAGQIHRIDGLLTQADDKLSAGNLSVTTAFISSLLILLREGLEAILVLAAIIAFVRKTGRRDALPYIHAGWLVALALGLVTWWVARYLLSISGASRELTEGVTALIAAVMLLYVGYWLHSKSYAHAWQSFIREKVTAALGKRTLWAMAGVSFLAVYRELFEVILFYEALWAQAGPQGRHAVLWGIVAAALLLSVVGGLILKYSVRLPIGPFFSATSGVLALLAVVFAGSGVAALQEAGAIGSTAVHFVSVPLLGIYPTVEGLLTQSVGIALVLLGVWSARRGAVLQRASG